MLATGEVTHFFRFLGASFLAATLTGLFAVFAIFDVWTLFLPVTAFFVIFFGALLDATLFEILGSFAVRRLFLEEPSQSLG